MDTERYRSNNLFTFPAVGYPDTNADAGPGFTGKCSGWFYLRVSENILPDTCISLSGFPSFSDIPRQG